MNSPLVAFLRTHKAKVVLAIVVVGTLLAWFSVRQPAEPPDARTGKQETPSAGKKSAARTPAAGTSFDFYLLALTVHPAFCADGREDMSECRNAAAPPAGDPWPVAREARAAHLSARLPGAAARPRCRPGAATRRLHARHGGRICTSTSGASTAAAAGSTTMSTSSARSSWRASWTRRWARRLTTLAGRDTSAAELRETADLFQPGHRRHVHAALSHAAWLGRPPGAHRGPPVRRQRRRRAARPAHCSTAPRVQAARPGLRRVLPHRRRCADEPAVARVAHRIRRHRGRHASPGCCVMRADARAYWRWPVYSAMAMALGVMIWTWCANTCCRREWTLPIRATFYFCALALYSALGIAAGALARPTDPA